MFQEALACGILLLREYLSFRTRTYPGDLAGIKVIIFSLTICSSHVVDLATPHLSSKQRGDGNDRPC